MALPSEWVQLVKSTDKSNPFNVVYVEHPLTDNLRSDGIPVVKVYDFKRAFDPFVRSPQGISTVKGFHFKRGSAPLCRYSMTGGCGTTLMYLKRGQKVKSLIHALSPLLLRTAYHSFLPVKRAKLRDVQQLLKFVHLPVHATFYSVLTCDDESGIEPEEELE